MERPIFIVAIFAIFAAIINIFTFKAMNLFLLLISFLILMALIKYKELSNLFLLSLVIIPIVFFRHEAFLNQGKSLDNLKIKESKEANLSGFVSNLNKKDGLTSFRIYKGRLDYGNSNFDKLSLIVYYSGDLDIKEGDYLELSGKVQKLDEARNYGNFDSKNYYYSLGIKAKYTVSALNKKDSSNAGIKNFLYDLKLRMESVYKRVYNKEKIGLVTAMTLGDRSELSEEVKTDFKDSGIAHLLSISALHLSLVGLCIYNLLKKKLNIIIAAIISAFIMCSYLIITSNGISARRAIIMLLSYIIADNLARTNDIITSLSLAIIVLIIDNPYVITNTGFLLSFTCMAGIAFVYPVLINEDDFLIFFKRGKANSKDLKAVFKEKILEAFLLSLSVSIASLPIVLLMNYQYCLLQVLLNLIVIPLLSFLMFSALVTGIIGLISIGLATFFAGLSNYIIDFYFILTDFALSFKSLNIVTGGPRMGFVFLYYFSLVIIIVFYNLIKKEILIKYEYAFKRAIIAFLGAFIISLLSLRYKEKNGLNIHMIDVGQGDSIFASYDNKNYLFDAGSSDLKEVAKYRLIPTLKYMGVKKIDYVTISHFDSDHVNGIFELIEKSDREIAIGEIVIPDINISLDDENYKKLLDLAKEKNIKISRIKKGEFLEKKKDFSIVCLHPSKDYKYEDANDYSTSYLVSFKEFRFLSIGDCEERGEKAILENAKNMNLDLNKIDILKVGHHGSKTSSSTEFINVTCPKYSIISSGVNNSYGHPHKETIEKLDKINSKIYQTKERGEISINVNSKMDVKISTYLE